MTDKKTEDQALEALFEAARAAPPEAPQALMQQVLADAAALQPAARRPMSRWAQWMSMLGGAPGMGGLVAASCLGVWIGVAAPEGLPDLGGALVGTLATATDEVAVAALFEDGWVSGVEEGLDDE